MLFRSVEIDADRVFPDAARANNSWTPDKAAADGDGEKAPAKGETKVETKGEAKGGDK